ncbi:MAG: c-type cytochrome [Nitrospirae bacterium]|nr:c-type cytochrome [Nitrospirota bacterium]
MEDYDGIQERQDTSRRLPAGWLLFFIGVIAWGVYYTFVHVPIGTWSQYQAYDEEAGAAAPAMTASATINIPPAANPFKGQVEEIAEGRKHYSEMCASCHGEDGKGGMGPGIVGPQYVYGGGDGELYTSVMDGRPGGMPPFKDSLGEKKTWETLAYVESLKK